ncbi:ribosomal protein S18 acetylase RimI-like enzyme [Paenibacillus rhizosphaerae]|uniref:Ribosomal protein S18 acetylase RimI-like enzyme n=1 Tax=Paenibacillus rhizosphaerae TaxID=297318 RepID=A0A839TK55_9BACL|nr:GNAT family N-acetyltransferase [Paenibacillus rhizosphaerae]MBB3125778.1 ribosomal protein S18 acetylase RimI-like enzyme [Paenibacillus rhizosphaerae]
MYKFLEEITINTWPAKYSALMNGWLVRYADGYTKRANSVSPIYLDPGCDVDGCIAAAERFYRDAGQPVIFKMTPYVMPSDLDERLAGRGYVQVDLSSVRTLDLAVETPPAADPGLHMVFRDQLDAGWLEQMSLMNEIPDHRQSVLAYTLASTPLQQGFFQIQQGSETVAAGLGVIQQGWLGLYDIVTHPGFRQRGFGLQLIQRMLAWGRERGAHSSFLQVIQANEAACRLYDKLGYREVYSYWYRVLK